MEILEGDLVVYLEDGRTVCVPLEWFPKLRGGSPEALSDWRLIGHGVGIHWPISAAACWCRNRFTSFGRACRFRPLRPGSFQCRTVGTGCL